MSIIKGKLEHEKFLKGERLTRKQAIMAQCYVCNGEESGGEDCKGSSCPLYQYFAYKGKNYRFQRLKEESDTGVV